MIRTYEDQYIGIISEIMTNGYYDNNRTGIPTYKIPHQIITVDLEKEFPILSTKFVAFKTAVKELLWIYNGDNSVKHLQEQNVHIWDEWEMEDGTIGTSYGWIVENFNQLDKLINQLKTNPQDRRMMINLWQIPYLDTGALYPCCWCTMWDVTDGRLNCMLVQRSGDMPLGVPFNTTQYAVLVHMVAQVTGLKVGKLTHVINNAHIYKNQLDGIEEQVNRYKRLLSYSLITSLKDIKDNSTTEYFKERIVKDGTNIEELEKDEKLKEAYNCSPKLILNPDITNFHDFTIDDINLEGYSHMGSIKMPVAV